MNELGRSSLAKGTHRGPAGAHPAVAGTTVANQLMATCNRLLTSSGHGGDTSRGAHRAEGAGVATCTLSSPHPIAQRENVTLSDGHRQRHDLPAATQRHACAQSHLHTDSDDLTCSALTCTYNTLINTNVGVSPVRKLITPGGWAGDQRFTLNRAKL